MLLSSDSLATKDTQLLQAARQTWFYLEYGLFEAPTPSQPRSCPANETVRRRCPPLEKDASYALVVNSYLVSF